MSSNEGSTHTASTRKVGRGRPVGKIWDYFDKGAQVSKGYYSATCFFCGYYWATAKPSRLKKHIAYDCEKVDSDTKVKILTLILSDQVDSDEDASSTSTTKKKASQIDIEENFPTSPDKEIQINKALVKLFICCNLPFSLIEHPFFHEFIKVLRATYTLPTRWILSNTFLPQEFARVDIRITNIVNDEINLTIAFDGWTNPSGESIYDYCLITEERKEYLWLSKNYSDVFHTGAFLGDELIKVVENIGPEKLAGVVSDNASNACIARRILCEKYPHILNIRCVAHSINLITKDLCKHVIVVKTIQKVGVIHQYFVKSHAMGKYLKDAIEVLQIRGGGLKSHTKTRWSTMWDCISSIARLELAFARVNFNLYEMHLFY
jgi:Protein of unknown function (DUF 659)